MDEWVNVISPAGYHVDQAIVVARRSWNHTCLHRFQEVQCLYTRQVLLVDPQTADHRRTPLEVTNLSGTGTVARWSFLPAGQPPDMIFTELEVKDLFLLLRVFLRR
jgi:hypothetical protein